jgi:hypothetical protein
VIVEVNLTLIPDEVLKNMIRLQQIPVIPSNEWTTWADNRVCCRCGPGEDPPGPQHCGMISADRASCRLGDGRPCAFDEPESADIWERIREQQRFDK